MADDITIDADIPRLTLFNIVLDDIQLQQYCIGLWRIRPRDQWQWPIWLFPFQFNDIVFGGPEPMMMQYCVKADCDIDLMVLW